MIDLFYRPAPNGHRIKMFLEEAGPEFRIDGICARPGTRRAHARAQ